MWVYTLLGDGARGTEGDNGDGGGVRQRWLKVESNRFGFQRGEKKRVKKGVKI